MTGGIIKSRVVQMVDTSGALVAINQPCPSLPGFSIWFQFWSGDGIVFFIKADDFTGFLGSFPISGASVSTPLRQTVSWRDESSPKVGRK